MPSREELEREAAAILGGSTDAPAVAAPSRADLEREAAILTSDTEATTGAMEATRASALNRGESIDEPTALRRAAEAAPAYYALPRPLRALLGLNDDEARKFRRRAANLIERSGGGLAYWASRPQAETWGRGVKAILESQPGGAEAMAKLAETLPDDLKLHEAEVPSEEQHDQLDDVAAASAGTNWLDAEPEYMERLSADFDAEKQYVVEKYGGDWNAYQDDLKQMPLAKRIGRRLNFVAQDIAAPDPLFLIEAPLKLLRLAPAGLKMIDQAIAARRAGEPLAAVRGAEETIEAVSGPIGQLTRHVDKLESKLEGMTEQAGSQAYDRVHKRLLEARAELDARLVDAADPGTRLYRAPRLRPQAVYTPMGDMAPEELVKRQELAEGLASVSDVDAAVKAEGYRDSGQFIEEMDRAFHALSTGGEDVAALRAFERLPEPAKQHLDALGVSRRRIMEAAALARGEAEDIARHADLSNPALAAGRALMGPDDVEEAGTALAHMRDGGNPAHVPVHGVDAPEYSVIGQGNVQVADGIWLRDMPDYRNKNVGGLRELSRRDAFNYLLGRQSTMGLAEGSYHIDAGSLTRAANRVGRAMAFGASKVAPISLSAYVPEVADFHKKATRNYHLMTSENEDVLRAALVRSGFVKLNKNNTVKATKEGKPALDRVIDLLDTEVDPETGTSEALQGLLSKSSPKEIELYRTLRSWFDAQAIRLGLDRGTSISGYFPHLFPELQRRQGFRQLEYHGMGRLAHTSFWALHERTGAKGWDRDLVNTLDLYNRGATRKVVMEPAYKRIVDMIDEMRAAGKHDEANLTEAFLKDARGMAGPSIFGRAADLMGVPEGARDKTEWVVQNATALMYKALLGGNLNYGLQNMAGGLTNTAAQHGPFQVMQGLLQFATPSGRKLAEESGVYKQALHSLDNMPSNTIKAFEDAYRVMDVGQRTETVLRGSAVLTALGEQVARSGRTWQEIRASGLDEAFVREASRMADRSQHTFGPLGRSPYLHSLLGHTAHQALTQLGTYPYKQTEFLLRGMKEDPGMIVKYLALSGIAARMAAESFGVALSPSVGFGFADSMWNPRNNRVVPYAPGPELVASLADLFVAWRSGDPAEVEKMQQRLERAASSATLGLNQMERYARSLRESLAGKKEKFFEQEPLTEVGRQLFSGEAEVRRAERALSPQERIVHALGVRTVEDQAEVRERREKRQEKFSRQRRKMEAKQQRRAELRDKERLLEAYDRAVRRGDGAEVHRLYEEGAAKGLMNFSADGRQAAREAAFLRKRLRTLRAAPGFLEIE